MPFQPYFQRRAQIIVTVTRPDATGAQTPQTYTFEQHRMRIVVRQGGKQFGNAVMKVFGVPLATMNQIARLWLEALTPQNTDTVAINVWDGVGFVPFFSGIITWSAVNASTQPQVALDIEANAAMEGMNTTASPYANAGPVSLQDALYGIANAAGLSVDYSKSAPQYQMTQVRAVGTPVEQISALLAQYPALTWNINLQRLIVRAALAPIDDDPVRIAPDTGMIGYPVYSTSGLQISTLFDARIRPGLALDVESEFDFITRTKWVSSVLAHTLDVNVPGGQWMTQIAANSYGSKGNTDG